MDKLINHFPDGAASRQLDKFRNTWFEKYGNPFLSDAQWPKEVNIMDSMISALGMVSSCVAYGSFDDFYIKHGCMYPESYYEHYLADYIKEGGTKEDFDEMLAVQKKHYLRKESYVEQNVQTDWEGCSYNSLIEPEERFIA